LKEFNDKNRKPYTLPCGHNMCLKCVYLMKKNNNFKCFLDEITFPENIEINKNLMIEF